MTVNLSALGSTAVSAGDAGAVYEKQKSGRTHARQTIKTEGTVLDEYRKQGVDLELSGANEKEQILSEEELKREQQEKQENSLRKMYQEQAEAAKEAAEGMSEEFEDMARALEIARRMMNGDIVPGSDEKFLMDFDKDMYLGAKTMQGLAQKEDPEKYDSILEEEEDSEGEADTGLDGNMTIRAEGLNLCQPAQSGNNS